MSYNIDEKNKLKEKDMKEWGMLFKIGVTVFITFTCCTAIFFVFYRYKGFASVWSKFMRSASSIIIGLVLAYLMNPIMKFFEGIVLKLIEAKSKDKDKAKKTARAVGIVGSVVTLILFISLLIASLVPSIRDSIIELEKQDYVHKFTETISNGNYGDNKYVKMGIEWISQMTDKIDDWTTNTIVPELTTYAQQITVGIYGFVKGILNFIIGIVVMIYVMAIQETLIGQTKKIIFAIFKPKRANVIVKTIRKADKIFGGFITGKMIDSLIIGILCYFGCLILKIPNKELIAVIIGVTNVVPVFGPFIGAIPCLFLVVIQSPIHALYLFIFIIVLQQVDGNIIGPKILGSSTGLSTFWVMFAILIGGGMFGFMGMLLGVPTVGVIYYIIKQIVNNLLTKKGLPINTKSFYAMKSVDRYTNDMVYELDEDEQEDANQDAMKRQNTKDKEIIDMIKAEKKKLQEKELREREAKEARVSKEKEDSESSKKDPK